MVDKKKDVIRCKCTNSYSWLFWLIFLAMVGYLVYYVISTIEELKANPEEFFAVINTTREVIAWL